jgi:L-amino acid N-acyltransferase YncA
MSNVQLRKAQSEDVDILFRWLNDPVNIAAKLATTVPVPYETHCAWFHKRLEDENSCIWIATLKLTDIGQARVQLNSECELEVDIYVDPDNRGQGIASSILSELARKCALTWPTTPLVAVIRNENLASMALFARAGYKMSEIEAEFRKVRRKPLDYEEF